MSRKRPENSGSILVQSQQSLHLFWEKPRFYKGIKQVDRGLEIL